ncbi:MAG: site-2 protease family protein [Candidatus Zambryskibacteria bacterium]|nr:site-2 protease family protein [Candidatus Zambryskibacteria bacterium]
MDFFFQILILIMSIVIHEVSHGYAARHLGDRTAEYEGRLTLNPLKHLDPIGSLLVPLFSYILGGFIIGWAKPVPYNPYNLRPGRWSEAIVAGAGPLSNIAIALIFGVLLRGALSGEVGWASPAFIEITSIIVLINIILAVFNLMPVPPLDGSKILFALFPAHFTQFRAFFERYGLVLLIFFVFFIWQLIFPLVVLLFSLIAGVPL